MDSYSLPQVESRTGMSSKAVCQSTCDFQYPQQDHGFCLRPSLKDVYGNYNSYKEKKALPFYLVLNNMSLGMKCLVHFFSPLGVPLFKLLFLLI